MARPIRGLELDVEHRQELEALVRASTSSQRSVLRAKIVLACADGSSPSGAGGFGSWAWPAWRMPPGAAVSPPCRRLVAPCFSPNPRDRPGGDPATACARWPA